MLRNLALGFAFQTTTTEEYVIFDAEFTHVYFSVSAHSVVGVYAVDTRITLRIVACPICSRLIEQFVSYAPLRLHRLRSCQHQGTESTSRTAEESNVEPQSRD
jgi:hypothetical protein